MWAGVTTVFLSTQLILNILIRQKNSPVELNRDLRQLQSKGTQNARSADSQLELALASRVCSLPLCLSLVRCYIQRVILPNSLAHHSSTKIDRFIYQKPSPFCECLKLSWSLIVIATNTAIATYPLKPMTMTMTKTMTIIALCNVPRA